MHELTRPRACSLREVASLADQNFQAASRGVPRDPCAIDASADDGQINKTVIAHRARPHTALLRPAHGIPLASRGPLPSDARADGGARHERRRGNSEKPCKRCPFPYPGSERDLLARANATWRSLRALSAWTRTVRPKLD